MSEVTEKNAKEFVLQLYHESLLTKGYIEKNELYSKFREYVRKNKIKYTAGEKLGTVLRKWNLLLNTDKNSTKFCIRLNTIYDYKNKIIAQFDQERILSYDKSSVLTQITDENQEQIILNDQLDEEILQYQRSYTIRIDSEFCATNTSCYVCQKNFATIKSFEEHVEYHKNEFDMAAARNFIKSSSVFQIGYQHCLNSYYLKFTLRTEQRDIVIDKIITFQSKWMTTLKKDEFYMPSDGICCFYVDRHVFSIGWEQPVIIVFRNKYVKDIRTVEHHSFTRLEEFPPILNSKLNLITSKVSCRKELKLLNSLINDFDTPVRITNLFKTNPRFSPDDLAAVNADIREYIDSSYQLNVFNITSVLSTLLQMEEIESTMEVQKNNITRTTVARHGREYSVKLKSGDFIDLLKPGDQVVLKPTNQNNIYHASTSTNRKNKMNEFRGRIEAIYGSKVYFHEGARTRFKIRDGSELYDVEFFPNRLPFKIQYHALNVIKNNSKFKTFLFPDVTIPQSPAQLRRLNVFNKNIDRNPEQLQAVNNILDGLKEFAPYIIFGPPGTGKTTTIVEAILQLREHKPESRILITAGSNAACDEIGQRLLKLLKSINSNDMQILRIYSKSAEKRLENINELLIEASNLAHGCHFYPCLETITSYPIIICTLAITGRLVFSGLSSTYFTHCFIDECAAVTEPESLIAISAVFHSKINVILSGDTKQLGPILQSSRAELLGLSNSLMTRLLNRNCYSTKQNGDYNRSIQTRLVRNFRTHPDILRISNSLFYSNQLIACATKDITHWAGNWFLLPEKNVPIIFNSCNGCSKLDRRSRREIDVVMDYVKNLMYFGINGRQVKEEDIGIISPYKKQNIIIREELDNLRWYKIDTGSVETYQGQEKPIIIISTVRSINSDRKGVGFLNNEKRLNVMLTRAQALLIIVGSPECLANVPNWQSVIGYIDEKKATTGAKFTLKNVNSISISSLSDNFNQLKVNENRYTSDLSSKFDRDQNYVDRWVETTKKIDPPAKINTISFINSNAKTAPPVPTRIPKNIAPQIPTITPRMTAPPVPTTIPRYVTTTSRISTDGSNLSTTSNFRVSHSQSSNNKIAVILPEMRRSDNLYSVNANPYPSNRVNSSIINLPNIPELNKKKKDKCSIL